MPTAPRTCASLQSSSYYAVRDVCRPAMNARPERKRLDLLLFERGLAESQQKAQAMILAGEVQVNGARADKAGESIPEDARIEVHSRAQKYASRGGLKLEGALEEFQISPAARVCLDVGASNGGFTDCLLQHGAIRVYAVDVTVSQLAWKLQQDSRVVKIEKNARELAAGDLPEPVALVTVDVSFISAAKVLEPVCALLRPGTELLILIKPQFELRREDIGPGGIVKDAKLHEHAVARVRRAVETGRCEALGHRASCLTGAEGNQEYFLHARKRPVE